MSPDETAPAPTPAIPDSELAAKVARMIEKKGDSSEAIGLVLSENQKYRDRHRDDTRIIEQLRADLKKAALPEGSVVVGKEDAALLATVKELKVTAEEVTSLRNFKAATERKDATRLAAEAVGYNPDVLADLLGMKGMATVMKDVPVPDEKDKTKVVTKSVPHVVPVTDLNATPKPLTEYAEQHLVTYLPALRKVAAEGATGRKSARTDAGVVPYPEQSNARDTGKTPSSGREAATAFAEQMFAPPSKLNPAKPNPV